MTTLSWVALGPARLREKMTQTSEFHFWIYCTKQEIAQLSCKELNNFQLHDQQIHHAMKDTGNILLCTKVHNKVQEI